MSGPVALPIDLDRVVVPASFEELFLAERVGLYGSLWLVTLPTRWCGWRST